MILRLVRARIALKLRRRDSDMRHPAYAPMLVGPPRPPLFKRCPLANNDDPFYEHRYGISYSHWPGNIGYRADDD